MKRLDEEQRVEIGCVGVCVCVCVHVTEMGKKIKKIEKSFQRIK